MLASPRISEGQWPCIAFSLSLTYSILGDSGLVYLDFGPGQHQLPFREPSRVSGRAAFQDCLFSRTCALIILAAYPGPTAQDSATLGDFDRLVHTQHHGVHRLTNPSFQLAAHPQYFGLTCLIFINYWK